MYKNEAHKFISTLIVRQIIKWNTMMLIISCMMCTFILYGNSIESNLSTLGSKIVGGETVLQGTIRYMASLRINKNHFCGGCLISSVHVLTAAQCINTIYSFGGENYINTTVFFGSTKSSGIGIIRGVKSIEHHPNFDPFNRKHSSAFDIGLILLNKVIVETIQASEISFSKVNVTFLMIVDIAGWGTEKIVGPETPLNCLKMSPTLKKIVIRILGSKSCQSSYKNIVWNNETQACGVGKGKTTTAWGDTGSPVVKDRELIGITSHVPISRKTILPTLFIKVSAFQNYIKEGMIRLKLVT